MNRILFISLLLLSSFVNAQSDGCSAATLISVTSNCSSPVSGTTVGATQTISGCVGTADDDVWYKFVATSTSHNISVTGNGTFDAVIQAFSGGCSILNSIACQDQSFGGGTETIYATGLTIGATYTYRVYDYYSGAPGTFTTCVTAAASAPANDAICSSTLLSVSSSCVNTSSTSVAATQSMTGCAGNADDDVWFRFVATNSIQTITVDPSSSMDAVVQLFEGTCSSLLSINCEDNGYTDGNEVINAIGLTPGTTYYVRVYDYYTATGGAPFQICVTGAATSAPSNDEPCGAIDLPAVTAACNYLNFNTSLATLTPTTAGVPSPASCVGGSGGAGGLTASSKDVWFTVTIPASGTINITAEPNISGGISDGSLALYSGTCSSLSLISCSSDHNAYPGTANNYQPYLSYTGVPGTVLYIRYWGFNASHGDFGLCVSSPTNDACANALYICDLNGYSASTSAAYTPDRPGTGSGQMYGNGESNTGIFTSPTNTSHTGGPFGYANGTSPSGYYDVTIDNNSWITFTASATTATLTISVYDCWLNAGIQMQIFSGTNCDNFVSVSNFEENATGFVITASGLTIGQDYYLMVDGYAGDICNYTITADSGVAFPEITATDNPICSGASTELTAPANATSYLWSPGGATTQAVTVSPSTTTTYSCVVEGVCGYKQTLTYTVNVNQLPTLSTTNSNSICSGIALNIPLTANITSTYTWVAASNNTDVTGESLSNQTSSTINNTLVNNTTGAEIVNYTVTPTAISTGCEGPARTVSVTVNPLPSMTSANTATICSSETLNIGLTSNIASSYQWRATANGNITGESTTYQSGSTINNTLTNTSTSTQVVNYSVIPTSSSGLCTGTTQNVAVTVNPSPTMTSTTTNTICSGATLNIGLTSNVASSYSWIANPAVSTVTGESTSSQSGNTINNTLTNTTATVQSVAYDVTPTSTTGLCVGSTQTVNVTVNPTPTMTSATTATICSGDALSIGLTSNVASSYSWVANPAVATVTGESTTSQSGNTINNTLTNTTTTAQTVSYDVIPTSTTGSCAGTTQTVVATVNPSPTMTSSNTSTICSGATLNIGLTSNLASTFEWQATSNGNVTGESITTQTGSTINNTLTNTSATVENVIYTVTPTTIAGTCEGADQTVTVTVNPLPSATASANSPCVGSALTLTGGTGLSTYLWNGPNSYTSNLQSPTVNSSATTAMNGTYTLTVTNSTTSCTNTATTAVTVNAPPVVNISNIVETDPTSCGTATGSITGITVTGSPTLTYSWNSTPVQTGLNLTGVIAGSYSLTVTDGNTCTTPAGPFSLSDPTPPATPTLTVVPGPLCAGGSFTINIDAPIAGATYNWTSTPSGYTNTGNSITVTNASAGAVTYTATPTLASCVGSGGSASVTVNALPIATITPSASEVDCNNPIITLDGSGSSQGSNIDYAWTTPSGNITAGVTTDEATADSAGVYTLTVENKTTGCISSSNTTLTLDQTSPIADAGSDVNFPCGVNDVALDGSGSTGTGITYSWSGPGTITGGTTTTPDVSGTGAYTLTVTGANGCTATDIVDVIPNSNAPIADAGTAIIITCNNPLPVSLDGTGSDAGATITYNWTTTGTGIITNGTSTTPTVDQAGTYRITVTNSTNSCNAFADIVVSVDTISPVADASATQVTIITCTSGFETTLDASNSTGTGLTYVWTTTNGIIDIQTGINATVIAAGDYELEVEGNNGCTNLTSINVTIDTVTPLIDISPSDTLNCNLASVTIDASSSTGVSETYQWSTLDGSILSGDNTNTVTVGSAGNYVLTITNDNGCSVNTSTTINSNANPIADFTPSILTGTIPLDVDFLNNSIGSNLSNAWTFGDGNTSTDVNPSNTFEELGTYTVELVVIDEFGCSDTAEVIIDASGDYTIVIPNVFTPNGDGNNDVFGVDIKHASELQATIFNRWGQLMYEWEGTEGGWDGYTYSGVLASEGTYFYLFIVTDIKGIVHEYQGHFRLAR